MISDQNGRKSLDISDPGQNGQIGQDPQADAPRSCCPADDGGDGAELEQGVL